MSDAILLLRLEHTHMAAVLEVLDTQIARLEAGEPPAIALLRNVVEYVAGYPDACHHPKEDLVFRKLRQRSPAVAEAAADLEQEHAGLAQLTQRFSDALNEAEQAPGAAAPLRDVLKEFVRSYRHHMDMEEKHFFPSALRELTPNDWAEIDFDLFDRPDPLFDHEAEERYRELRAEIARLAHKRRP